jgi:hypothetical protein
MAHNLLNISEIYEYIQNNFDSQRITMSEGTLFHITKHSQFWSHTSVKHVHLYIIKFWPSFVSIAVTHQMRGRRIKSWIEYFSANFIIILGKNKYSEGQVVFFLDQFDEPVSVE